MEYLQKDVKLPDEVENLHSNRDSEEQKERCERSGKSGLEYAVPEFPPWHITGIYAVQQILANIGSAIATVYVIHGAVCTEGYEGSDLLLAQMLNATIFMMGLASLLQTALGIRLPIVQGSSATFIAPIIAMMNTEEFACPDYTGDASGNGTSPEPWEPRLEVIAGSLMAASGIQMVFGITGIMGILMNYIGPLTVIPTVSLIGLTLFETATAGAQHQWGICVLTVALIVIFSILLNEVSVPLPTWSKRHGCSYDKYRIFRLFPHIFAIAIAWSLSYILTVTDVFPPSTVNETNFARTDAKIDVIAQAEWFLFPYPGRICGIDFNVGVFAGMSAAVLSSIIESVGDYYSTAQICQLPPPSKHAVNRGILMEGIASLLSGSLGIAHSTTSFSGTIGFIAVTGMASRWVWEVMGVILMALGLFGKFGAALAIIPDPIIGALQVVGLGMVISIAFSNIHHVDMQSSRNLLTLAISHMFGMMLPFYLADNPDAINTGNTDLDQVLTVLLSTGMLVGGVIGFTMDNLLPGTKEERGMISFQNAQKTIDAKAIDGKNPMEIYDLPYVTPYLKKISCCSYVPIMPNFNEDHFKCCSCNRCRKQKDTQDNADDVTSTSNDDQHLPYVVSNSNDDKYSDEVTTNGNIDNPRSTNF